MSVTVGFSAALPHRRAWWAFVAPIVVLASACASGQSRNPFEGEAGTVRGDRIRVEVQNLNFNDATVYALRSSQRIRVGRVTGKTDQSFTIDWDTAQPIAFQIDIVSGRGCRTGVVTVDRDSRVWVTIPSNIGMEVCRAGRR